MAGELRARRWLLLDAVYCGGAGLLALALALPLGHLFHIPFSIVAAAGIATIAWSLILLRLARRPTWREPLRVVAAANAAASVGVAVLVVFAPAVAPRLLLAAVSLEVAAFAVVQARMLRRLS
jgi:hypothetical protein